MTTTTKNSIPDGTILEFRLRRLLFYMGYLPKGNIQIRTSQDTDGLEVTDLDAFGVYIQKDFNSKNIWVDCKSGKIKANERITWIKGVLKTFEIDEVLFVAPNVRTEIKKHAKNSNIQITNSDGISALEKSYDVPENNWRGSWNYENIIPLSTTFSKITIPENTQYKKIHQFIYSDYWNQTPYANLKKIITALRFIKTVDGLPLKPIQQKSIKWAKYELINLFALTLLNISREIQYFSVIEREQVLIDSFSAGDIPDTKRTEFFDAAMRIAFSYVQHQIPEFKMPDSIPKFQLKPPGYIEVLIDIINRIIKQPKKFYDILRFLDYILMEYDLNKNKVVHEDLIEIFGDYSNLKYGSKSIITALSTIVDFDKKEFSFFNDTLFNL